VPDDRSIESLTAEDFRPHRGSSFRLLTTVAANDPEVTVELELVEVTELSAGANGAFRAPFTVLFHGPLTPIMPQAIYRLRNERFGTFDFFIVPIGPADPAAPGQPTAMRYEVVFG
jgi:hypothetical protein